MPASVYHGSPGRTSPGLPDEVGVVDWEDDDPAVAGRVGDDAGADQQPASPAPQHQQPGGVLPTSG